jgi:hypothetical protein
MTFGCRATGRRHLFLRFSCILGLGVLLFLPVAEGSAWAQSTASAVDPSAVAKLPDSVALARRLRNPVTSLINFPLVENFDFGGGPNDNGYRSTLNIEPIIPISLDEKWKIVSRSTIPVIDQRNIIPGTSQDGLGDSIERLLLSPAKSDRLGINWGVGPAFMVPTATNTHLGYDRWGTGPAVAFNWHNEEWTASVLAYQIFSVAGGGNHAIDTVTIQPSLSYVFPTSTTLTLGCDSNYDVRAAQYTCPLNLTVYQLTKIDGQLINFGAGLRCYVARPAGAAQWGLRVSMTFLCPMAK